MISSGLAVGTDLVEVEVSGDAVDLVSVAGVIADMHGGDVVHLRCDGLPSVVWPTRLGLLELVMTGSGPITIEVDLERIRLEFSPDDRELLRSAFEGEASAGPGSHCHVDADTLDDRVTAGSARLIIAPTDPPLSLPGRQEAVMRVLLGPEHDRHPEAAASLGELLADDPMRRSFGVKIAARALLGDDRPVCHGAHADLLVRLVSGDVPSWGIDLVMDVLLVTHEHESLDSRRNAIDRILTAWTEPR